MDSSCTESVVEVVRGVEIQQREIVKMGMLSTKKFGRGRSYVRGEQWRHRDPCAGAGRTVRS